MQFPLSHTNDAGAGAYNEVEYLMERAPMMQAYRLHTLKAAAGENIVALNGNARPLSPVLKPLPAANHF